MPTTNCSAIVIQTATPHCGGYRSANTPENASKTPHEDTSSREETAPRIVKVVTATGYDLIHTQCDAAAIKNFFIWSGLHCTLFFGPDETEVIIHGR